MILSSSTNTVAVEQSKISVNGVKVNELVKFIEVKDGLVHRVGVTVHTNDVIETSDGYVIVSVKFNNSEDMESSSDTHLTVTSNMTQIIFVEND